MTNPQNDRQQTVQTNTNSSSKVQATIGDDIAVRTQKMAVLLGLEAAARDANSVEELAYKLVNDPKSLTEFAQGFCFKATSNFRFSCVAITGQTDVNANAPFIQMLETVLNTLARENNLENTLTCNITDVETNWTSEQRTYPYPHLFWVPINSQNEDRKVEQFGGVLFARHIPWRDVDRVILQRIVSTYAYSWETLALRQKARPKRSHKKHFLIAGGLIALAAAMFIPVPYTIVSPAQIVGKNPYIISAPIDGVIDDVHVSPNETVKTDTVLFSYVDTSLRNNADIAASELVLATARRNTIARTAIVNEDGRRELALAQAELQLASTKKSYADEILNQVRVRSETNGIVLFEGKQEIKGRPVVTGEKIMEIASPDRVEVSIDVPISEGTTLEAGQSVSVFLDANPLDSLHGKIIRTGVQPVSTDHGTLAYRAFVDLEIDDHALPRIGLRGSAKIHMGKTQLGYWLFRKPIVVIRRQLGL